MNPVGTANAERIWQAIAMEAKAVAQTEPALARLLFAAVTGRRDLGDAIAFQIGQRLGGNETFADAARDVFRVSPDIVDAACCDLEAILDQDPATGSRLSILQNFKGFVALQAWRVSNWLWLHSRRELALMMQQAASEELQVSIHPAASIGSSIFLDHGTGIVVGATATIADGVTILQDVTIGRVDSGDSPRIETGVYIGGGATVLGDIVIGAFAKIGAGSVVMHDVPPGCTAIGVPAALVNCPEPLAAP